jgi:hypothetical protein
MRRRTAGKTHTLYPESCWHKHAHADCYHCGTRERACRMQWLKHPQHDAFVALCASCYPRHNPLVRSGGSAAHVSLRGRTGRGHAAAGEQERQRNGET